MLSLHGPVHSFLIYYFTPLTDATIQEWTLSVEGDKSQFVAKDDYTLLPQPSVAPDDGAPSSPAGSTPR